MEHSRIIYKKDEYFLHIHTRKTNYITKFVEFIFFKNTQNYYRCSSIILFNGKSSFVLNSHEIKLNSH